MELDGKCAVCGLVTTFKPRPQRYLKYCSECYNDGRAREHKGLAPLSEVSRPDSLHDTGMRIDDYNDELTHPDGRVETPVPKWVRYPKYFFDTAKEYPLTLSVLEKVRRK